MFSIFSLDKGKPLALQRFFLKILGISFSQTESRAYRIYSSVFLFCTIFTYPLVQCAECFKFYNNLEVLSVVITIGSVMLIGIPKVSTLLYNRKSIGKTLDMLEQGMFATDSEKGGPQEAIWIKKRIQLINLQSVLYFGGVYATVILGVFEAVSNRIKSNDYRNWTFPAGYFSLLDVTHSPNFEIACMYQTFGVTICFGIIMLCDTFIGGTLAHIATQFKILQHRIRLIVENAHKRMMKDKPAHSTDAVDPSNIPWKYLHEALKETVINHTKIIKLAETFEDQFSYLVLVQFMATCSTLCFGMYYCSLFSVTDYKFMEYMIGVADVAVQALFYCYWGNEVSLQSLEIAEACNEVNFVGTDVRFQKGLLLIMLRSQKPIKLTAGKFTPLSLATYVWIIRASYSYYNVIRK